MLTPYLQTRLFWKDINPKPTVFQLPLANIKDSRSSKCQLFATRRHCLRVQQLERRAIGSVRAKVKCSPDTNWMVQSRLKICLHFKNVLS